MTTAGLESGIPPDSVVFILNLNTRGARDMAMHARLWAETAAEFGHPPHVIAASTPSVAAAAAAASHEAGAAAIFGCGGDGTLNAIVQGLPPGSPVPLGVVPIGTANVWAQEIALPDDRLLALQAQLTALPHPMTIDTGRLHTADALERRFLLMAGIGLDADAVRAVDPRLKRAIGKAAYGAAALRVLREEPRSVALAFDGQKPELHRAGMITICNTRRYAAVTEIAHRASVVDGMLDCVIFDGGAARAAAEAVLSLAELHTAAPGVSYRRFRRLSFTFAEPAPCQIDGEYVPQTPVEISVDPASLKVLAPLVHLPIFYPPDGIH